MSPRNGWTVLVILREGIRRIRGWRVFGAAALLIVAACSDHGGEISEGEAEVRGLLESLPVPAGYQADELEFEACGDNPEAACSDHAELELYPSSDESTIAETCTAATEVAEGWDVGQFVVWPDEEDSCGWSADVDHYLVDVWVPVADGDRPLIRVWFTDVGEPADLVPG